MQPRPVTILNEVSRQYPNAWKQVDLFVDAKTKGEISWENWCFMPIAGAYAIVSGGGDNTVSPMQSKDVAAVGALAAWRLSQGIYRFDPDLFASLWETPLNHQLPIDLFYRLPEWCLYVETPGQIVFQKDLHGFFVHIEHDQNDGHVELRLLLDYDDGILPFPVHLVQEGILQSVERMMKYTKKQTDKIGLNIELTEDLYKEGTEEITPLISLVLYICSTNSELINKDGRTRPNKPQAKKIKKGRKYFPADKPEQWDVGLRIGAALKKATVEYESSEQYDERRTSPRPHPRKAHWQTYWTGKGRERAEVRWKNMILVNIEDGSVVPTLHAVEK